MSKISRGIQFIKDTADYFYQGWRSGLILPYLNHFLSLCKQSFYHLHHVIHLKKKEAKNIDDDQFIRLQNTTGGLYHLIPKSNRFSYSFLMPVKNPNIKFFETALRSLLKQSVSNFEILIGYDGIPSIQITDIVESNKILFPNCIKDFVFCFEEHESTIINQLCQNANGNYIIIMGQEDWLRPDFLFRYEQTLRLLKQPEMAVLYCDENQLNDKNYFIPLSEKKKPTELYFPYFFDFFDEKGLMIPKHLWMLAGGLRDLHQGAIYEDLLLRLDHCKATFQHIPLTLYTSRKHTASQTYKSTNSLLKCLEDYSHSKKLHWNFSIGYRETDVKAIPEIKNDHCVQIIIPFKDQKNLTLKCIQSIYKQNYNNFKITAVDNASQDTSIASEIISLGGEVITINEPFNYSRLNNLAVKKTKYVRQCDVVLFLNNDVELEPDALLEMLRWIDQPKIGVVGCRLHYPDGRLQHGGVSLKRDVTHLMQWDHIEKMKTFNQMTLSKKLMVTDAVTAACAMMRRDLFHEVGGFDEVWYPIAYSDTNLAMKLRQKGYLALYTPYAVGVHHESVSRKENLEDFDSSWWLHNMVRMESDRRH